MPFDWYDVWPDSSSPPPPSEEEGCDGKFCVSARRGTSPPSDEWVAYLERIEEKRRKSEERTMIVMVASCFLLLSMKFQLDSLKREIRRGSDSRYF